ncbi:MAG: arginase family protein [Burkholderiales bacterium]|nr:arginase family protein [Burkholderiales bacterium]
MGVPHRSAPGDAKAVVLGLPFDCGAHPHRIGSRLGPSAIRKQSLLIRRYDAETGIDPLASLRVIDLGDARVQPGAVEASYRGIEAALDVALSNGAVPLTMGGDGAIALPEMRALHRRHPSLAAVHLDAHTDAYPIDGHNTATAFARAVDEGIIDARRSFHIGVRSSLLVPHVYEYGRQLGYTIVSTEELLRRGIDDVFAQVERIIENRPVYLCFDMDVFDPSVAPGVCTPAWGGLSTREGLAALRACGRLDVVGMDVNTISPPHDPGDMSAFLAAHVMFEFLVMLAQRARGAGSI